MIKAVIFDVGGVLHTDENEFVKQDIIDTLSISEETYSRAYSRLVPQLGKGEISESEFWKQFLVETGSKKKLPSESLWQREYAKRFKKNLEVLKLVEKLKKSGLKLGILSNTIDPHAQVNRREGVFALFDEVVLSHEVGLRKPDPEMFKLILERLKVKPEEAVFVDDLVENVEAAKKLGIDSIIFVDQHQLSVDLKFRIPEIQI